MLKLILKPILIRRHTGPHTRKRHKYNQELIKENLELYSLMLPVLILIFIFCYIPMYGVVIAFQNYTPGTPFISFDGSVNWVGLKHFINFVQGNYFGRLLKNTIVLSGLNLLFGFWVPIAFALLVNEISYLKFRKFVQTTSYLPYFISTVVVAGMVISFLDKGGLLYALFTYLGVDLKNVRFNSNAFPIIYTLTNIWKGFGFGSILYLSTISSIDPALYESARLDGAGRVRQIRHITIPGLKHIIAINLIMGLGGILGSNTELILLLYTPATYETADVIGTYIYRLGILGGQFSYTAASGLFMSVIGFCLTYLTNKVSNKLTGYGLW